MVKRKDIRKQMDFISTLYHEECPKHSGCYKLTNPCVFAACDGCLLRMFYKSLGILIKEYNELKTYD